MSAPLQGRQVGIYVRVSEDKADDTKAIGRQEADSRTLVKAQGGTVAKVYAENDTSAYGKRRVRITDEYGVTRYAYRVVRPVYAELLADLRAGVIDGAAVYDIDRLARDPRDLEDAIEVVEQHSRPIVGVTGALDLLTDGGRAMARVMVAMANKSSADTGRRVKRKHEDLAKEGMRVGGTRPFGWERDKLTLHPDEAPLVREAAERILKGGTLSAIVTDWNARGIRTPRKRKGSDEGNRWTPKALGLVLTNPGVCGLTARNMAGPDGKTALTIVTRDGVPVQGNWEPILDVATWDAVCASLSPRSRRPGGNAHKYLLSGLLRCGKCGGPMRGLPRTRAGGAVTYSYQCHSRALGGCGGVAVIGPPVDALVTERAFLRYDARRPSPDDVPSWDGQDDLDRVTRKLTELHAAWKADLIDGASHFAMRRELEDEARVLKADRAQALAAKVRADSAPEDIRAVWDRYELTRQRAWLADQLVAVVVTPSARRGQPVEDRLTLHWQADQ